MKLEERLRKELDEIKIIKADLKEAKETYEELANNYEQLITAFNKAIPQGFFQ